MEKFHSLDDVAEKMNKLSILDLEKENVVKAFREKPQPIKWIDDFKNILPETMSVVNICLSQGTVLQHANNSR